MAVKKSYTKDVEVNIEEEVAIEVDMEESETEAYAKVEEPAVELEIDTSSISEKKQADKTVRIKMATDHRCWINTELYDLKKGQCYNVPVDLKERLTVAGALLPL